MKVISVLSSLALFMSSNSWAITQLAEQTKLDDLIARVEDLEDYEANSKKRD